VKNNNGFSNILVISLILVLLGIGGYFASVYILAPTTKNVQTESNQDAEVVLKQEIEKKNEELQNLTKKFEEVQKQTNDLQIQIIDFKKQISSKDSEISSLKKEISSKESNLDKLSSSLTKQEACNKMNEYSQLSSELQFRYGGAGEGEDAWRRCTSTISSQVGSNTENAYEYVSGWYENYKNTGSIYYKHNPDLCLDDVEKSLSKLKDRRDKYRDYKKKCENK